MENRNTKPNGDKIRDLRGEAGMTQDILGVKSNVDRRTIQRAEAGKPMQMESLAGIASALNVPLSQIIETAEKTEGDVDIDDLAAQSLIVLRPVEAGMTLINMIHGCFDGKITCEAEPTPENIEALTALTSAIEAMMPDPWRLPSDDPAVPLSAKLRQAVELNGQIKQLEGFGIAAYMAAYTAQAQRPYYDVDTGEMYISNRTRISLVTICRIMIAPIARGDRITLKVDDLYVPPKAPAFEPADTEDIPF